VARARRDLRRWTPPRKHRAPCAGPLAAEPALALKHFARRRLQWQWAAYQALLLALWNNEGVKKALERANEPAIPESACGARC
jgi:hypothetical protein